MKKCPVCGKGNLRPAMVEEKMFGFPLGTYKGEVCDKCGESFLPQEAMSEIEKKAKEIGIWGLAEKIKVVKSGNSLCIRIPAKLARYLGLKEGREILVYPEGAKKAAFEVT